MSVVFSRHWTKIRYTIEPWSAILATDFSLEVMFRRVGLPPYSQKPTRRDHIRWGSKGFWNASVVFCRHWTQIRHARMTLLKDKISYSVFSNEFVDSLLCLLPKRSKMIKETQRVSFWSIWNVGRVIFHCSRPIRCQARHPLLLYWAKRKWKMCLLTICANQKISLFNKITGNVFNKIINYCSIF